MAWQDPPEIRIERVQSDGFLVIHRPDLLAHLAAPWPEAQAEEIVIELKLAGDHVDRKTVERALLRRQARQLQRLEDRDPGWLGDEPLWLIAPHVPAWLEQSRTPVRIADGCYRVEPYGRHFLWIAANELPLRDELVPFLIARSGKALDQFARWVAARLPLEWVLSMLEYLSMTTSVRDELLWRFAKTDDPEVEARQDRILEVLLAVRPQMKERLIEEGIEKGIEKGIERGVEKGRQQLLEEMLRTLLVRHLQRDLTPPEQAALSAKASTLDGQQAAEAMLSLDGDALRTWLLGPDTA